MKDMEKWIQTFAERLRETFGERLHFVGLQGSHARGEATEKSDIDTVLILDELSAGDIDTYNALLDGLEHRELVCGFLSGKEELLNWDTKELFQFYYDTKPLIGNLDELLPKIDEEAVRGAIKTAACGIYHGCVHNMLYEKSEDVLRGLYKSASFALQAICYRESGKYVIRQRDMWALLSPEDRMIGETFVGLKEGGEVDFRPMSRLLFAWSKKLICSA